MRNPFGLPKRGAYKNKKQHRWSPHKKALFTMPKKVLFTTVPSLSPMTPPPTPEPIEVNHTTPIELDFIADDATPPATPEVRSESPDTKRWGQGKAQYGKVNRKRWIHNVNIVPDSSLTESVFKVQQIDSDGCAKGRAFLVKRSDFREYN